MRQMSENIENTSRPFRNQSVSHIFWFYVNNIMEVGNQDSVCQPKQKRSGLLLSLHRILLHIKIMEDCLT